MYIIYCYIGDYICLICNHICKDHTLICKVGGYIVCWCRDLYRLLSLSVPQSLSLKCASLKWSHPLYIWGCDPQSLSFHKHIRWVCLSHSIHISRRRHLWILVCLVHIQFLWLARLTAKKMPLFPLLLLWIAMTQKSVPLIVHHGYFGILRSCLVVFCFSCVWMHWNWYSIGRPRIVKYSNHLTKYYEDCKGILSSKIQRCRQQRRK